MTNYTAKEIRKAEKEIDTYGEIADQLKGILMNIKALGNPEELECDLLDDLLTGVNGKIDCYRAVLSRDEEDNVESRFASVYA